MAEKHWEVIEEVAGTIQAEILRGFLEAQGIPVTLSQEGAGHSAFSVTVGPLGKVQVLVPSDYTDRANQVLNDYHQGKFETDEEWDDDTLNSQSS